MDGIGQPERATQDRVITLLRDELGYCYLGSGETRVKTPVRTPVKFGPRKGGRWEVLE